MAANALENPLSLGVPEGAVVEELIGSGPIARVIGSYGERGTYLQVGEAIGAKTFSIASSTWDKMSPAARWAANQKFLDQGIAEGAEFVLSTQPGKIKPGTTLAKEVKYLLDNGYKWSSDGLSLLPK